MLQALRRCFAKDCGEHPTMAACYSDLGRACARKTRWTRWRGSSGSFKAPGKMRTFNYALRTCRLEGSVPGESTAAFCGIEINKRTVSSCWLKGSKLDYCFSATVTLCTFSPFSVIPSSVCVLVFPSFERMRWMV